MATELSIDVGGVDPVRRTEDLRLWLHEARIRGVDTLRQEQRPPGPGEQGPELLALLSVVLSGPAIIELVRSIHRWIEASRPTVTITIKSGERTVSIDSRNPKRLEELVAAAERLSGD